MNIQGLEKGSCEHFVNNNRLFTICEGKIYYDLDLPEYILNLRQKELNSDFEAQASLNCLGIFDNNERLLQFIKCRFGGNDNMPDTIMHKSNTADYWNCGKRGNCKAEFSLCCQIIAENGRLSRAEIEVIKLISKDLADKQIADLLNVSENTIHTHRYNITKKIGCSSKNGIVAFAYEKGILK